MLHYITGFLKFVSFYEIYLNGEVYNFYDVLIQRLYRLLHILKCTLDSTMWALKMVSIWPKYVGENKK
jgi:hypothetical protein